MSDAPTPADSTIRLTDPVTAHRGRELFLKPGDTLVTINGKGFRGTERDLAARFKELAQGQLALGFRRNGVVFTVLSDSPALGVWEPAPVPKDVEEKPINPAILRNWEILASADKTYDLQPLSTGVLALVAAPLWLLQMRLWIPGAALFAAAMVSLAVSPVMFAAVYISSGLHIWYAGPRYFRKDRLHLGMKPQYVLAAPHERAAHAALLRLEPSARFAFAAQQMQTQTSGPASQ